MAQMNGIIEKSTGDLVEAGCIDANVLDSIIEANYDVETHECRENVPRPPKVRGDKQTDMMDRWNGSKWIEVDQP